MNKKICVFTTICEPDSKYLDQYLNETFRLDLGFVVHFDRCSGATKLRMMEHPNFVASTAIDNPKHKYDERDKQEAMDIVRDRGYIWALQWDMDETYEKLAPEKLRLVEESPNDVIITPWINLWNSPEFIRTDGHFSLGSILGKREKFYRVNGGSNIRWRYKSAIVYGPSPSIETKVNEQWLDLACLHWGYMTLGDRKLHKARWDHNYTAVFGRNPYGTWEYILDEVTNVPVIVENPYL